MKSTTTITIDGELRKQAKQAGINLSQFVEMQLKHDLNPLARIEKIQLRLEEIENEKEKLIAEIGRIHNEVKTRVIDQKEQQERIEKEKQEKERISALNFTWEELKQKNKELANIVYCSTRQQKGTKALEYRISFFQKAETDKNFEQDLLEKAKRNGYDGTGNTQEN